MASENTALQQPTGVVGEVRTGQVDCQGKLRSGVTIASVTSVAASGLTITNAQVNGSTLTINGSSVAAGKAVQFTVTGAAAGTYEIRVTCVLSNGETGVVFKLPYVLEA